MIWTVFLSIRISTAAFTSTYEGLLVYFPFFVCGDVYMVVERAYLEFSGTTLKHSARRDSIDRPAKSRMILSVAFLNRF